MAKTSLTADQVLDVLRTTPQRLADLTSGSRPSALVRRPEPDEWSANEVLAHLRSCADVWGAYILDMTQRGVTAIRAVNPTTWIKQTDYDEQPFRRSLKAFTDQRTDLMAVLDSLTPDDWSRTATVTGAGSPLTKTVLSYGDRMARHERTHLGQIERALRKPQG